MATARTGTGVAAAAAAAEIDTESQAFLMKVDTSSGGDGSDHNNDEEGHASSPKDGSAGGLSQAVLKYILLHILQIANILLWYYTNGMNGIAMQSFAKIVKDRLPETSSTLQFLSTFQITTFVTYRQLLLGSLVGYILLMLLNRNTKSIGNSWKEASMNIIHLLKISHWWPLSGLHAIGSLATNVGFMYGKASVIQVIKLLEPFETLLLSQLLFQEGNCSIGVVSSMAVVVGSAMSLLKLQSKPPLPQAVIAAVASGLTLSCRNILQRKHHHQHSTVTASTSNTSTNNTTVPSRTGSSNNHIDDPVKPAQPAPRVSLSDLTKLEKSILQFTQLSFYSGLWMGVLSFMLWLVIVAPDSHESIESTTTSTTNATPIQVLLWHPLYNVFSMITLGFCSALTHSLLNAGKRVFAICMAMLWFREGLNAQTIAGLLLVGTGGAWYSAESKGAKKGSSTNSTTHRQPSSSWTPMKILIKQDNTVRPVIKLISAVVLLSCLIQFQSLQS
jgi:drug/metabolite transporter (DMT)-like permease